jgi:hypothetical protein
MQQQPYSKTSIRSGGKAGIWLALLVALGLHTVILFVPVSKPTPNVADGGSQIEVQLVDIFNQTPDLPEPVKLPDVLPEPVNPVVEPLKRVVEAPVDTIAPMPIHETPAEDKTSNFEELTKTQKSQLANSILAAQFITEESVTDQLFGMQFNLEITDPQQDFHYPVRQSMVAMLDQPIPELPFAYSPGLVRFAYEPGVKGDLQRFWDVITPEFGWRTKNGTEFKCIWVLVIGGCGWK